MCLSSSNGFSSARSQACIQSVTNFVPNALAITKLRLLLWVNCSLLMHATLIVKLNFGTFLKIKFQKCLTNLCALCIWTSVCFHLYYASNAKIHRNLAATFYLVRFFLKNMRKCLGQSSSNYHKFMSFFGLHAILLFIFFGVWEFSVWQWWIKISSTYTLRDRSASNMGKSFKWMDNKMDSIWIFLRGMGRRGWIFKMLILWFP